MLSIRYRNTFRDLMGFCFHHYLRSPVVIGSYAVGFILTSFVIFKILPKDQTLFWRAVAFIVLNLLVLFIFATLFALSVVLSMVSRRNKTVLTEHTLTLAEDGFTEETQFNKSQSKWAAVQKLARNKKYLFIYVVQHGAHVVPRRAFRDDAEWDAFYEYCKQHAFANPMEPLPG